MNALALLFAHGILQKDLANKEAMNIFENVDALILQISNRFWGNRDKNKSAT